ncbi:MAG: ferritin [Candidatus Omnitrophica bacterium]|nr:ferritin [Candidatus Omnitrophota bacterium]
MISKKVAKLINQQIAIEAESAAIYLAMATWAEHNAFRGTASFMFKQAEEERIHMHKFIHFLAEVGEHAQIDGMKAPKASYKDIQEVFEASLAHERQVTAAINNMMTVARAENDYAVTSFLKWFIDEQVEEEAVAQQALDIVKMAGKVSLYLADKEIGAMKGGK